VLFKTCLRKKLKSSFQVQKREISSFRSKGDAQPEDVIQAQLDIQMWINHLISLNTKFGRLNNAMRLEVADSFVQIFKSMRELQVWKSMTLSPKC